MVVEPTPTEMEVGKSPTTEPLVESYKADINAEVVNSKVKATLQIPTSPSKPPENCCVNLNPIHLVDSTTLPKPIGFPDIGPTEDLVPLGCFGPFPNNTPLFSFTSLHYQNGEIVADLEFNCEGKKREIGIRRGSGHPNSQLRTWHPRLRRSNQDEIGAAIGFQVDAENAILAETLADSGEKRCDH
ncbi:unnamed protein product [Lactuca virosa]|uniref:Uncharacterized protein n=1 Tax=Lactuca virosa TaxID=75947 RepID=A0AAU9PGR4_9ASTR|nr:unnamed protein product [Lactuca virosa]